MVTYVVIPWDAQSFLIDASRLAPVQTLEEAARRVAGPADCVMALEDGNQRALTATEEKLLREAIHSQKGLV